MIAQQETGQNKLMPEEGKVVRTITATFIGGALFSLYLFFASYFLGPAVTGHMNDVEAAIFYTMILRVFALLTVPMLRKLHPQVKILLLSFETFVLLALILFEFITGATVFANLIETILSSWLAATLIFITPYSICELALLMRRGTTNSLMELVISIAPLTAICLFLAGLNNRIPNPANGLSNFGIQVIDSLRLQPNLAGASGPNSSGGASILFSGASVVIFISTLVYVAYSLDLESRSLSIVPKYHYIIALMVAGALILFLWLSFFSVFLPKGNVFEILTVPSVAVPIVLWVMGSRRTQKDLI